MSLIRRKLPAEPERCPLPSKTALFPGFLPFNVLLKCTPPSNFFDPSLPLSLSSDKTAENRLLLSSPVIQNSDFPLQSSLKAPGEFCFFIFPPPPCERSSTFFVSQGILGSKSGDFSKAPIPISFLPSGRLSWISQVRSLAGKDDGAPSPFFSGNFFFPFLCPPFFFSCYSIIGPW